MTRIHVMMALESESQGQLEHHGAKVTYTGIGKVNAALAMAEVLNAYSGAERPLIVNFGSVGSHRYPTHHIVSCTTFVQRDMDCTVLGVPRGITPFDPTPATLTGEHLFSDLPTAVCGTGDSIETQRSGDTADYDVVDMEAYALAKACARAGARFASVKFVTDGSDHAMVQDWQANLRAAALAFGGLYARLRTAN
jgi:adenosylhomocysteine nucleosidase